MIRLDDLAGIAEDTRKHIVSCLDSLMTLRNSAGKLQPIISGYNWYIEPVKCDRVITFSNIHETEEYKKDMIQDLVAEGYDAQMIMKHIRKKAGAFLWKPKFRLHKDGGSLLPGLRIKDIVTGEYVDLSKFDKPLINYQEFSNKYGSLIGEDQGWEAVIPFNSEIELLKLITLFLKKSGTHIYDEVGNERSETEIERKIRRPWTDAYDTPILILGEKAVAHKNKLPEFEEAVKLCLVENNNEFSFVIHNNWDRLTNSAHYQTLLRCGFNKEPCLCNKPFLKYID